MPSLVDLLADCTFLGFRDTESSDSATPWLSSGSFEIGFLPNNRAWSLRTSDRVEDVLEGLGLFLFGGVTEDVPGSLDFFAGEADMVHRFPVIH